MQVEDIKVLNIDGTPYAVDGMSDAIKQMVNVYNSWNQKEVNVRDELLMVQAAKNDLSRQIIMQVRKEKEDAAKSAANEPEVESVEAAADEGGNTEEETPTTE